MQLQVMMKPMFGDSGNVTPVLCDGEGNPLPMQAAVEIKTAVDDLATVTVTFVGLKFAA